METEFGTQEHTVAFYAADYVPKHRAKLTFREWVAEVFDTAPVWALVCVGLGTLLAFFTFLSLIVWLW